jgi:putative glutamine amidotransferase
MYPIIGITCSTTDSGNSVGTSYVSALENVGGIPVLLPSVRNEQCILEFINLIDGLLLSGGVDVDPYLFGEEPKPLMGKIDCDRDYIEMRLIQKALEIDLPILGICRGIQVLNVTAGGTLYQDISMHSKGILKHRQDAPGSYATHSIEIKPGSRLMNILSDLKIRTNTFHHQAVREAAPGFIISAYAQDKIIEGIESINHSFVMGVQFHPELMWQNNHPITNLFHTFVNAAKEYKPRQKGL